MTVAPPRESPTIDEVTYSDVRHDALDRVANASDVFLWRFNHRRDAWRAVVPRLGPDPVLPNGHVDANYPRGYELLGVAEGRAVMYLFRAGLVGALLTGEPTRRPVCPALLTPRGFTALARWDREFPYVG